MENPSDFGFYMPAEWAPHSGCWMAWPCRESVWSNQTATKRQYAAVAQAIAHFEPVNMVVPPRCLPDARQYLDPRINITAMEIDDSWARDSGPNFLVNDRGELAGSRWRFNAWGGKYHPYDQDAMMASRVLALVGAREFASGLTAEGGGITVDGEGTVITTESCFLNSNRNPDWTRQDVEQELCRTLGAGKVIWIPGDVNETETDGHIDGIAAFVRPGVVLVEVNPDSTDPHYPVGQENAAALRGRTDARGRELQLVYVHEASYHKADYDDGCRSYINSYLANGAVVVPGYGSARDAEAVATYQRLYPERQIVQVQILDIASGGGGIHCITQQQPVA